METSVESLHGSCVNLYLDTIYNGGKQHDITQNVIEGILLEVELLRAVLVKPLKTVYN